MHPDPDFIDTFGVDLVGVKDVTSFELGVCKSKNILEKCSQSFMRAN